jgi:DNA-binding transcriptional ArsR family regulator
MSREASEELLDFFKALADANRLKIVGLLAQHESSVEDLTSQLGISVSTVSHHLGMLSYVGLVSARAEGHYFIYKLEVENLREKARRLLSEETLPRLSEQGDGDAYEKKVLTTFIDSEGRIKSFPAQEKKFVVLLHHVAKSFEPGKRYPEKQVNEMLLKFNKDTASLRRGMIEYHIMDREGGGGEYWLV